MDPVPKAEEEKKKRTRKAPAKKQEPAPVVEDGEEKKKRGRKPKHVYNANDPVAALPVTSLSDDENVIVRLQVVDEPSDECAEEQPCAYNNDAYTNIQGFDTLEVEREIASKEAAAACDIGALKVVDILKDFEQKNKNNEWPSNTSISCYWCCHKFDNAPYGIPVSYSTEGGFEVYGCFCSLECAAAFNFKSNDSLDEVWERYNLINLLSRRMNQGRHVKPAPDKMTLKMFGGFMDIDAFRKYHLSNKVITVHFPPMTSLTQQIEEVNEYELNSDRTYIPIDSDRINRCKEKMIFQRNKPLLGDKSTLESAMNLKYS